MTDELEIAAGEVDPGIAAEFPELRLWLAHVSGSGFCEASGAGVREQLAGLSSRIRGPEAVALRTKPIPHAYRVFFRHIGLDPDEDRIPVEEVVVERLKAGGFRPANRILDAVTIAVMETQVPIWAADAAALPGALRIGMDGTRLALLAGDAYVSSLFGPTRPEFGVTATTTDVTLYSLTVAGVPPLHVEEAMWLVQEALVSGEV